MAKAGRGSEQVMIRLPDGMRNRIRLAAERNNRSMNAEIVEALEYSFPDPPPLDERLSEILVTLGTLASQTEDETPEGILAKFTNEVVETFASIRDGVWETDSRTQQIAANALAKLEKAPK